MKLNDVYTKSAQSVERNWMKDSSETLTEAKEVARWAEGHGVRRI